MVSNILLLHINQRLVEIFWCNSNIPFVGLTVIFCGDFFPASTYPGTAIYSDYNDDWQNLIHFRRMFKLAELSEVMHQKGDDKFIDLLNNVRTASISDHDEKILKSRFIQNNGVDYPTDVLHIFAKNRPADQHNSVMLNEIS